MRLLSVVNRAITGLHFQTDDEGEDMVPERLILLRTAHELSQRELAAVLDVTPAYISQIEAGKKKGSSRFHAKCADYFRIEVSVLFRRPRCVTLAGAS